MGDKNHERVLRREIAMTKCIHYINQFFAGIGGEELADYEPEIREGVVGPGLALEKALDAEVTHTIICGDNFMATHEDEAVGRIIDMLKDKDFDIFIAGPTFQAGRYGFAAGRICKAVQEKFKNVKVYSSMHEENPGVEMYKSEMIIFKGGKSAASMRSDVKAIAKYVNKVFSGEPLLPAEEEGYYGRGIRHQYWPEEIKPAAKRGVEMLIKKLNGEAYETELPVPKKDVVPIAEPIKDLKTAKIAILTTGGIVPVDNPDRIQSASATRWGRYDISNMERLEGGVFKTIHAGFDPAAANADPNVIVPLDALNKLLEDGVYGSLHSYFYSTVGTGTTQAEAERMAREILDYLIADGVDGVIMTST